MNFNHYKLAIALAITLYAGRANIDGEIQQPVGLYRLFTIDQTPEGDPDATNANCDGFRIQLSWADYEPTEGTYLWNTSTVPADCSGSGGNKLDRALCVARANKKGVGIAFAAGANAPAWLYTSIYKFILDASDQTVGGNSFMPIIWQSLYQTKLHNFILAAQNHINSRLGHDQIRYVVATGVSKQIDMSTWCQNIDASVVASDATLTNVDATYCRIDSATAHFLTHADQSSGSIVGKTISDTGPNCLNNSVCILRNNSLVCNTTPSAGCPGGAPANPTDTTVYINKNAFTTGANKVVTIQEWLPGRGEFYQMDQIAKNPPAGYGFVANPNGMDDTNGARTGSYVPAAETIVGFWATEFSGYNVILTRSAPYPTTQGTIDNATINTDLTASYGDRYGAMSVARQASCPPHSDTATFETGPHGSQAIYPSGNPSIYQGGACPFKGPSAVQDLIYAGFDHNDKYSELYQADMASVNPATGDPALAAMATYARSRLRYYNPQTAQAARIQVK